MKVVIIADVSGSVSREQLNALLFPTMDGLEAAEHDVWVVFADTAVRAVLRPKKIRFQQSKLELIGRGGTDMQSVRREVAASMKPDFMVIISDGMY